MKRKYKNFTTNDKSLIAEANRILRKNGFRWNGQPISERSQSIFSTPAAGAPGLGKSA